MSHPNINLEGIYMPIKLRTLLRTYRISQADWCKSILQDNNKIMSRAMGTRILTGDAWPKLTPKESIKKQTQSFLILKGFSAKEISTIWEEEMDELNRSSRYPKQKEAPMGSNPESQTESKNIEFKLPEPVMLSQDAKKHFKIIQNPFSKTIENAKQVWVDGPYKSVYQEFKFSAKHARFVAFIAESGWGKSTIKKRFSEWAQSQKEKTIIIQPDSINTAGLNDRAVIEAILDRLNPGGSKPRTIEARFRKAKTLLMEHTRNDYKVCLLIEESHDLKALLRHLKRFWEFEDGWKKMLGIILIAQPEINNTLHSRNHDIREVYQRIEIIEPEFMGNYLEDYLAFKLSPFDIDVSSMFAADAFDALRTRLPQQKMTPLAVNNVITFAMNQAAALSEPALITAELILES